MTKTKIKAKSSSKSRTAERQRGIARTFSRAKSEPTVLILRACKADGSSKNGFRWPETGPVEAPDWSSVKECGQGLHGWLWGTGTIGVDVCPYLNEEGARWLVVEVKESAVVDLGGKVKFPRGEVIHCGTDRVVAANLVAARAPKGTIVHFSTATAGSSGTATAGNYGTATAGNYGTATAGDSGTATAGSFGTATAGYQGTATAGYQGTATAGDSGTATAGSFGTATAGEKGSILLRRWDTQLGRYRWVLGEVGFDGIEANVPYKLDAGGKLKRTDKK